MKKQNWILWVGLGIVAWYLWKQSKKTGAGPVIKLPGSAASTTPFGSSARAAADQAQNIVADVVSKTTFVEDVETDREKYKKDQISCK